MITDHCQRFTLGRESRRPAGELIKTAAFDVAPLATAADAEAFVELHHYARSCSSTAHRFGLYKAGALVGVACFGPPPSMNAHRAVFPTLSIKEAVTLGRLVLLDDVPGNGESWFIARCFELLASPALYRPLDRHGDPRQPIIGVESCADPQPRTTLGGDLIFRGHLGTIYCATNGRYVGRTQDSTLRLLPDGTCFSKRTASKLLKGERGNGRAISELMRWGAPSPASGEPIAAWLSTWRAQLTRTLRHRGCFRYLWCLDRRRRREVLSAPSLPYPKHPEWLAARAALEASPLAHDLI